MAVPAAYETECEYCGEDILEGDPIENDPMFGWVHEDCHDAIYKEFEE